MEAGRELDVFVAERVMGWTWKPDPAPHSDEMSDSLLMPDDEQYEGLGWDENGYPELTPEYSGNITDAWLVLDKLEADWRISLNQMWDGKTWQCSLEPMESLEEGMAIYPRVVKGSVFANAETPELAICLAAMKTVKEKDNDRSTRSRTKTRCID